MTDKLIIAAYGSHNAAIAMYYKGQYRVIEVERWLNKKNAGLVNYMPSAYPQIVFDEITDYLLSLTDTDVVDLYLTNYNDLSKITPKFVYREHRGFDHHKAHAATSFYQSPYDDALTFTFDGGGDMGFFNVYRTSRHGGIQLLERFNQDLGFAYMILADFMEDITRDPLNIGNLVYAGKLMGLCSYGNIREEWLDAFDEFYTTFNYVGDSYLGGAEAMVDAVPKLMAAIGIKYHKKMRLSGQLAWDIAATTQEAFERQFFKFADPYLNKHPDLAVTMSGGCALNVILNAKLLDKRSGKVFVPPNPSDCGVAVGGVLLDIAPENQVDLTYSGTPILDKHMFSSYIENDGFSVVEDVDVASLANFIENGNIVGIINGNSEHGPRALGNRSIMCNPVGNMKQILNDKVKHREWYRPFAPVVRLEDAGKYFHFPEGAQSRHMTYIAEVREEYQDVIPAVTHEDGTGRIQTVTRSQNEFIYDLLTEFDKISEHGVLLNTSFNVNGKPILTRISDALHILKTSEMDAVYYDGKLVFRKGDEEKYERNLISTNIKPLDDSTSVFVYVLPPENKLTEAYNVALASIIADNEYVTLIANIDVTVALEEAYGDTVSYYELATNMLYYHEDVTLPMNHLEYSPWMRMLWSKNIMAKNYFRTKNHMFVTLDGSVDILSVPNKVKMIQSLAVDDGKVITSSTRSSTIKDLGDITKFYNIGITVPEIVPTYDIVWGSIESVEWLSTQIEAYMLVLLREGSIEHNLVDDTAFGLIPFTSNTVRFKLI